MHAPTHNHFQLVHRCGGRELKSRAHLEGDTDEPNEANVAVETKIKR